MRSVKKESKIGMRTRSTRPRDLRDFSAIFGTSPRSPGPLRDLRDLEVLVFERLLATGFSSFRLIPLIAAH
ncbi:hypothetical protein F2Q69_00048675 [Brassica cretica]|uniref:Uncharacterized protein n=1 Tax=Brassica cretica TaxID=69181 RepID=A0A8S9PSJ3_BRACR|nr:hypothetical protein F2Q69_00048675 [Brassica cretica]